MGELLWVSAGADGYAERGCGLSHFLQICRVKAQTLLVGEGSGHRVLNLQIRLRALSYWNRGQFSVQKPSETLGCNFFCHTEYPPSLLSALAAANELALVGWFFPPHFAVRYLLREAYPHARVKLDLSFQGLSSSWKRAIVELLPNCRHIHVCPKWSITA